MEALKDGAPQVHDDAPGNLCYDWELGDKAAVDAAIANAHHVTRLDLVNTRLIPNAIEPRAAIGEYDAEPTEQFDVRQFAEGLDKTSWEEAREQVRKGLWVYFYHMPKIGIAPYIPTTELNSKHFQWPEHPDWENENFLSINQENAHEVYTQRYGIYNWLEDGKVPVMGSE